MGSSSASPPSSSRLPPRMLFKCDSYSSGNAGTTEACLPPSGRLPSLYKILVSTADSAGHEKRLPSLMEILPHIIPQLIRPREFLNKMLNSILSQTKEIGPRNGVGMLPIANLIRRLDDHRPCTRRCPSDDGFRLVITCNYLKLGAISPIQNRAMIDNLHGRIDSR